MGVRYGRNGDAYSQTVSGERRRSTIPCVHGSEGPRSWVSYTLVLAGESEPSCTGYVHANTLPPPQQPNNYVTYNRTSNYVDPNNK